MNDNRSRAETFVRRMEALLGRGGRPEDRGALARWRRSLGRPIEDQMGLLAELHRATAGQGVDDNDLWAYGLVAGLIGLVRKPGCHDDHELHRSMAAALARINREKEAAGPRSADHEANGEAAPERLSGADRRFVILLDTDRDGLVFRLPQVLAAWQSDAAISVLPFDWAQLLVDLLNWEHPERLVQRTWARHYFGRRAANDSVPTDDDDPELLAPGLPETDTVPTEEDSDVD